MQHSSCAQAAYAAAVLALRRDAFSPVCGARRLPAGAFAMLFASASGLLCRHADMAQGTRLPRIYFAAFPPLLLPRYCHTPRPLLFRATIHAVRDTITVTPSLARRLTPPRAVRSPFSFTFHCFTPLLPTPDYHYGITTPFMPLLSFEWSGFFACC